MELSVARPDPYYDAWYWCTKRGQLPPDYADNYSSCGSLLDDYGINGLSKEEVMKILPNDNGQYRVLSGAEQKTRVSRTGFDLNNRFRLHPRLNITLSTDYQKEKLEEEVEIVNSQDLFNLAGMVTGLTKLAGPRGGERREWGTNLVFDWQATDRLKISAGIRYYNFRGFDTALAEGRARRDPRYQAGGRRHGCLRRWGFLGLYGTGGGSGAARLGCGGRTAPSGLPIGQYRRHCRRRAGHTGTWC